tara:strand:- start:2857 stop:4131 length:1275 start_codon:yes stop_codon:yes gene_type:complete
MKEKYNLLSKGELLFKAGILFLISAPLIGIILIIFSAILSIYINKKSIIKDNLNIPIFISIGILLVSTLRNLIFFHGISNRTDLLFDIFNWIPFFIIFLAIPAYLNKQSQREEFSKLIIISAFPILISSFLQKFFNIYGPFSFLNGLIVWYQREPGIISSKSITGLFNNPNYTGFILCAVIPFLIFEIIQNRKNLLNLLICIIILGLFLLNINLTQSRNAMIGALFSIILSFSLKIILFILISAILMITIIYLCGNILGIETLLILTNQIINKLSFINFTSLSKTIRYEIWQKSSFIILDKPLLGWGGSTFAALYLLKGGNYNIQHAHNLPLQMAQSYGLAFSLILTSLIVFLIFKGLRIEYNNSNSINKYWIISLLIASFHQSFDVVLYDGRLNIFFCILVAGSKCIINSENKNIISRSSSIC